MRVLKDFVTTIQVSLFYPFHVFFTQSNGLLLVLGSPVQCRPSPSPVPEGLSEDHCNCEDIEYANPEMRTNLSRTSRCPIHIRLRENCRNGRSLQQMLEVHACTYILCISYVHS